MIERESQEKFNPLNTPSGRLISLVCNFYLSGQYTKGQELIDQLKKKKHSSFRNLGRNIDPKRIYIAEELPTQLRYITSMRTIPFNKMKTLAAAKKDKRDKIAQKTAQLIQDSSKINIVRTALERIYLNRQQRQHMRVFLAAGDQSFDDAYNDICWKNLGGFAGQVDADLKDMAAKLAESARVSLPITIPLAEAAVRAASLVLNPSKPVKTKSKTSTN